MKKVLFAFVIAALLISVASANPNRSILQGLSYQSIQGVAPEVRPYTQSDWRFESNSFQLGPKGPTSKWVQASRAAATGNPVYNVAWPQGKIFISIFGDEPGAGPAMVLLSKKKGIRAVVKSDIITASQTRYMVSTSYLAPREYIYYERPGVYIPDVDQERSWVNIRLRVLKASDNSVVAEQVADLMQDVANGQGYKNFLVQNLVSGQNYYAEMALEVTVRSNASIVGMATLGGGRSASSPDGSMDGLVIKNIQFAPFEVKRAN